MSFLPNIINDAGEIINNLRKPVQGPLDKVGQQIQQGIQGSALNAIGTGQWSKVLPRIQSTATQYIDPNTGTLDPNKVAFGGEMEDVNPYPYSKAPTPIQKLGQGQNQAVRQIKLPFDVGGAQDEAAVHDTLNRLGLKGTADQQYTQLQPKMTEVNNWVQNHSSLATNPQDVGIEDVKKVLMNSVKKQFPVGAPPAGSAKNAVNQYINDLYTNGVTNPGDIVPSTISTPTIYEMKLAANKAIGNILRKVDNGTPITDLEKVTLAGRNAWDSIISQFHPDVKQATTDMSNLFNAADSLGRARTNPPPPKDFAGSILPPFISKQVVPPFIENGINRLANNPNALKKVGALALGGGIIAGTHYLDTPGNSFPNPIPAIADSLGYTQKNPGNNTNDVNGYQKAQQDTNHGQNITYLDPTYKPNPDGTWSLDTKQQPGGNYMTQAQFDEATKGISPSNPQYKRLSDQFAQSQSNASAEMGRNSGGIFNFMKRADLGMKGTNIMLNDINNLPTGFQNVWKQGLDVRKYLDNSNNPSNIQNAMSDIQLQNDKFSELYNNINLKSPSDDLLIKPGDTARQMYIKLNQQANFIKSNYKNYEDPYLASSTPTGTSNAAANQSTIQSELAPRTGSGDASAMFQDGSIPALNLPAINLPPIGR